jgi:hypothetical protein
MVSQSGFNGVLSAVGAAGAAASFIILVRPQYKTQAVWVAILILLVSLGVVGYLESLAGVGQTNG